LKKQNDCISKQCKSSEELTTEANR
jgi:hypothetical protein